jgi:hypothetical protein
VARAQAWAYSLRRTMPKVDFGFLAAHEVCPSFGGEDSLICLLLWC